MEKTKKSESTYALRFLMKVILATFWLVRVVLKGVAWSAYSALSLMDGRYKSGGRRKSSSAIAAANNELAQGRDFENTVAVEPVSRTNSEFKVADRILTIRLDPPVAVLHLRVYNSDRLVKREMIVTEPRLKALLQNRRHTLPDAAFDPSNGFEDIKSETVELAEQLINAKGNMKVKQARTSVDIQPKPAELPKAVEKVVKQVAKVAKPSQAQAETPKPKMVTPALPSGPSYVPSPVVGVAFEGELVSAGSRRVTPTGRPAYEVFEAKVRVSNGVDVPLRGAELERELEGMGIQLGERVSITPMGKVPVTLPGGKTGDKNVYRVARL